MSLKMLAVEVLRGTPTPPDRICLYIPGELPGQKKVFRTEVVLYVSANNPGAAAVAKDLCNGTGNAFTVTSDVSTASHFLLYLYLPTLEPLCIAMPPLLTCGVWMVLQK